MTCKNNREIEKIKKKQEKNKSYKTLIKNSIKKVKEEIKNKSSNISISLSYMQKIIDKANNKKVIHKNKADRLKSKLQKLSG